jgi:hypothetical protein
MSTKIADSSSPSTTLKLTDIFPEVVDGEIDMMSQRIGEKFEQNCRPVEFITDFNTEWMESNSTLFRFHNI